MARKWKWEHWASTVKLGVYEAEKMNMSQVGCVELYNEVPDPKYPNMPETKLREYVAILLLANGQFVRLEPNWIEEKFKTKEVS